MSEKRKHARHQCNLRAKFRYFEIDDDKVYFLDEEEGKKGKGTILDISRSGLLITTNSKLSINIPLIVTFKFKRDAHKIKGRVVRTGFWENNPSEIAKKFLSFSNSADIYIAVQFEQLIDQFEDGDL